MARAGTARTDRAGVARFDFRVGALSQAGLLLQEHSLGVIQSVGVSAERNTVMLKSGTPQQTVAVETISSDMIFTANINEKSKRNINLFLNTGVSADGYDKDKTTEYSVDTSGTGISVASNDTSITLSSLSFTGAQTVATTQLAGATDADTMVTAILAVTGINTANSKSAISKGADIVKGLASDDNSNNDQAYLLGATLASDTLTKAALCTSPVNENFASTVLTALYTVVNTTDVTSTSIAAYFKAGVDAVVAAATDVAVTTGAGVVAATVTAFTGAGAVHKNAGRTAMLAFLTTLSTNYGSATAAQLKALVNDVKVGVDYVVASVFVNTKGTVQSNKSPYTVGINRVKLFEVALATGSATTVDTPPIVASLLPYISKATASYFYYFTKGFNYVTTKVGAVSSTLALTDLSDASALALADKTTALANIGIEPGAYVIFDKQDPLTLAVIDVASFSSNVAYLKEGTTVGVEFVSGTDVVMYKANVIAPLRDFAMPYYSVRLVELDSKSRYPEVTDIWKCAITSGSNMTLNSTDFSAWDIVLTSVYPTISDMNGDLAHVKDKINTYGACARYMLNDI